MHILDCIAIPRDYAAHVRQFVLLLVVLFDFGHVPVKFDLHELCSLVRGYSLFLAGWVVDFVNFLLQSEGVFEALLGLLPDPLVLKVIMLLHCEVSKVFNHERLH